MVAYLHHIDTVVPAHAHQQSDLEAMFLSQIEDRRTRMLLKRSLRGSGIETRYSVCNEFFSNDLFDEKGRASTARRNQVYAKESRILANQLGQKLLDQCPDIDATDITHVIFATCTGFTNPGPDYHLISALGLRHTVQRYILGFMGCYATVPALRLAADICKADPKANVMVICLELCSLHLHFDASHDSVLANSLFADGAGGAIVSSRPPQQSSRSTAKLGDFHSDIIAEGEADMAWDIGDQGFDLVLSNRIPELLESAVGTIVNGLVDVESIDHWAIHPGGRGIIDKAQAAIPLQPEDLTISRQVMRDYGNMAGATLMFVLKEVLQNSQDGDNVLSLAFGPGLTVEAGLLEKC